MPAKSACKKQSTKKYTQRPSPPYPANQCPLTSRKKGNDGRMYKISKASNGVKRWVLATSKKAKSATKKRTAPKKKRSCSRVKRCRTCRHTRCRCKSKCRRPPSRSSICRKRRYMAGYTNAELYDLGLGPNCWY